MLVVVFFIITTTTIVAIIHLKMKTKTHKEDKLIMLNEHVWTFLNYILLLDY